MTNLPVGRLKQTRLTLPDMESTEQPSVSLLSDPPKRLDAWPVFTMAPNPNLADIVDVDRRPKAVAEPFLRNISSGKNTYVYDAHTYHTKVPPKGIELLIDYFTRPGDVVLDPFCGSGMTGVAATQLGRKAIVSDLSPAAAFIAYNLITPIDADQYLAAISKVVRMSKDLELELYGTHCRTCSQLTPALYTVWSFGLICSHCDQEFILWDVARDERPSVRESKLLSEFPCPHCNSWLKKRSLKRTKRYPVSIGYRCCGASLKENTSEPDTFDLDLLALIERDGVSRNQWYPVQKLPPGINTKQPISAGITSVDKMYTPRALRMMAHLWNLCSRWPDDDMRLKLLFTLTSLYQRVTVLSEFRFWGGSSNTANFNVPAVMNEQNVLKTFERKAKTISWYFRDAPQIDRSIRVSTQSACHLSQLPDQSIDYVFTDPPFGKNINYSEMNILWESWLGTFTDTTEEAIVNKVQGKGIEEYQNLLQTAFSEVRRVLKDDAWMTVVFHNSAANVWQALQQAILGAGFSVRGTQTFDKRHGTFKQFVSDNAVGYDLVLHCQKTANAESQQRVRAAEDDNEVKAFVSSQLHERDLDLTVRYLHVRRESEFDYRRLYAEWLAHALPQSLIGLSFEAFRRIVDEVIQEADSGV